MHFVDVTIGLGWMPVGSDVWGVRESLIDPTYITPDVVLSYAVHLVHQVPAKETRGVVPK